jgi:hypothetical protein
MRSAGETDSLPLLFMSLFEVVFTVGMAPWAQIEVAQDRLRPLAPFADHQARGRLAVLERSSSLGLGPTNQDPASRIHDWMGLISD